MINRATGTQVSPVAMPATPSRLGRNDPLLQELWQIKAELNARAEHDVRKRAEQARAFDLVAVLNRLRNA